MVFRPVLKTKSACVRPRTLGRLPKTPAFACSWDSAVMEMPVTRRRAAAPAVDRSAEIAKTVESRRQHREVFSACKALFGHRDTINANVVKEEWLLMQNRIELAERKKRRYQAELLLAVGSGEEV